MGKGVVFFDLDNTLYSFADTGLDTAMRGRIGEFFASALGLTAAAAADLSEKYYRDYGLSARGLALHHRDVDMARYLEHVHDVDYSAVRPCPGQRRLLEALAAGGQRLWVLTNGTRVHAERALTRLGILDLFEGPDGHTGVHSGDSAPGGRAAGPPGGADGAAAGRRLRVIDCLDMWAQTEDFRSKPCAEAYAAAAAIAGVAAGEQCTMVEDSLPNLRVPAELGWVPVLVTHGRQPADVGFDYHAVETIPCLYDWLPARLLGGQN